MAVTAGTWNIGGINLPDFGLTEKEPASYLAPQTFVNPLQTQQPTYQQPVVLPSSSQPGEVKGLSTSAPIQDRSIVDQSFPQPPTTSPAPKPAAPGVDWSKGLTGEQVRALGMNPDTMTATNGLYYSAGGGQQGGLSEADLNSAYNPIFDYLNQAESNVRSGYGGIQQDIGNQYGVSANTLGTSRSQNLAALDTSGQKVQQTKEDAMSQARRLYNELIGGYGQRFGGSTSAGEAARTLAGNEAQRTMGGVSRDFGNNMALIQQKKVEVDQNYQNGLMQLQATRDSALNQAKNDFQQKLLDISNTRASTASEKAQQKLAALQELRNQAYNIQLQNQQFAQQLALQKQADTTNLDSYLSQFTQSAQAGQTAQQGYNPQVSSNLQIGTNAVGGQSALTGKIGNRKDLTNQYMGPVAPNADERLFSNTFKFPTSY